MKYKEKVPKKSRMYRSTLQNDTIRKMVAEVRSLDAYQEKLERSEGRDGRYRIETEDGEDFLWGPEETFKNTQNNLTRLGDRVLNGPRDLSIRVAKVKTAAYDKMAEIHRRDLERSGHEDTYEAEMQVWSAENKKAREKIENSSYRGRIPSFARGTSTPVPKDKFSIPRGYETAAKQLRDQISRKLEDRFNS